MKLITKFWMKIIIIISVILLIYNIYGQVQATLNENLIKEKLEYNMRNIDVNNITKEDILKVYDEISQQYTQDDIATIIESHKKEIMQQGITEETITTGTNLIRTTDTEAIREIIANEVEIEDIKEKINQGYTANEIFKSVIQETSNEKKIEIATKLLLANKMIKLVFIIVLILFIYSTILRWKIYVKAKKPGWAAVIPLYRQIVMYQVCGLSPWLMLFWLIPIVGWIVMFIVAIMKRFCLANEFGKEGLFGFGLLLLPLIFQSILAFDTKIEKI